MTMFIDGARTSGLEIIDGGVVDAANEAITDGQPVDEPMVEPVPDAVEVAEIVGDRMPIHEVLGATIMRPKVLQGARPVAIGDERKKGPYLVPLGWNMVFHADGTITHEPHLVQFPE